MHGVIYTQNQATPEEGPLTKTELYAQLKLSPKKQVTNILNAPQATWINSHPEVRPYKPYDGSEQHFSPSSILLNTLLCQISTHHVYFLIHG